MSTIFIKLLITTKRKSPYPSGKGLEANRAEQEDQ